MNERIRFGGGRVGGKTFTHFWRMIHNIDPRIAKLLSEALEQNLTLKEEPMADTTITELLKEKMDSFESDIMEIAEQCYEEMSAKDIHLVKKWGEAVIRNGTTVWGMFSIIHLYTSHEKEMFLKFALAGYWFYHQTPEGAEMIQEKDGN